MTKPMSNVEDEYLVSRALDGDQSAVGEIYDRYADSIYSFCRSRLRNDADAADATQDTFVRAATRLSQLREPAKLRSWLYAIARNQVIATGKSAARFSGDDDMGLVIAPDSEPDIDLLRVEAADQLWDAADGLTPRDQEVLELHVRHGLVGHDLADALGVSESHANVMLSRMRDRVATSLGGLLVAREGRDECYELGLLLAAWDGRFTLDIRSKVTRHVKACDVCEQTRTRVLASGVSFGILPIIPAPSSLRSGTLGQMSNALGINPATSTQLPDGSLSLSFADPIQRAQPTVDSDGWTWQTDGFPGAVVENGRRGLMMLFAAAAFILFVVLGGVTAAVFNDGGDVETAAAIEVAGTVEVATTTTSSSTTVPPSVAAALAPNTEGTIETSTTEEQTSTTETATTETSNAEAPTTTATTIATTTAPTTVTSSTTQPTTTSTSTTRSTTSSTTTSTTTTSTTTTTEAPKNEPPVLRRASPRPAIVEIDQGSCPGDTALVIVQATDPDGEITSVVVEWESGKGGTTTTKLTKAAGAGTSLYSGTIGTWFVTGPQSSRVVATDDDGATAKTSVTVTVTDCPEG